MTKLEKDIWKFRKSQEKYWEWKSDKTCFKGMCQDVSRNLVTYLEELGYKAQRVSGYYEVPEEFCEKYHLDFEDGKWKHFWVIVNNTILADVTADQFHPGDENDYRVICDFENHSTEYCMKMMEYQI